MLSDFDDLAKEKRNLVTSMKKKDKHCFLQKFITDLQKLVNSLKLELLCLPN